MADFENNPETENTSVASNDLDAQESVEVAENTIEQDLKPEHPESEFPGIRQSSVITPNSGQETQFKVELPKVLDLGCGILLRAISKAPKLRAKELFKRLKQGEKVFLGDITVGGRLKLKLNLTLNAKEYVGPGFNLEVFRASVDQLLKKVAPRLRSKQNLNIRSNEDGVVLFDIPAGIRVKGQLNVMMLFMELNKVGEITMRLSYMDPEHFQVKE